MNFQGDPRIFFDEENGGDIVYESGQPKMDDALYNAFSISLYTDEDYWGNLVLVDQNEKLGSDYGVLTRLPITAGNLRRMEEGAEAALEWLIEEGIADKVAADVRNPFADRIEPLITITQPNANVSRYSTNWDNFEKEA